MTILVKYSKWFDLDSTILYMQQRYNVEVNCTLYILFYQYQLTQWLYSMLTVYDSFALSILFLVWGNIQHYVSFLFCRNSRNMVALVL
jgi:hypothetical protein